MRSVPLSLGSRTRLREEERGRAANCTIGTDSTRRQSAKPGKCHRHHHPTQLSQVPPPQASNKEVSHSRARAETERAEMFGMRRNNPAQPAGVGESDKYMACGKKHCYGVFDGTTGAAHYIECTPRPKRARTRAHPRARTLLLPSPLSSLRSLSG